MITPAAVDLVSDLRFRAAARKIHDRGPRFLCEFLAHIAADRSLRVYIEQLAERFLKLDVAAMEILGADIMPPAPIMLAIDNQIETVGSEGGAT